MAQRADQRAHHGGRAGALALAAALGLAVCPTGPACSTGSAGSAAFSTARLDFDSERAWKDLEKIVAFGPRPAGSQALEELRGFIEAELRALKLEPVREPFTAETPKGEIEMCNLYADFTADPVGEPGAERPAPTIYVASHIDTKLLPGFVGANDGGSSTAVVLELARAIVAGGKRKVTYRFLFLDGEEAVLRDWSGKDNTYGARHHTRALAKQPDFDPHHYKLVLIDLVGDRDLKLVKDGYSTTWMIDAFFDGARRIGLEKHLGRSQAMKDDHLRFIDLGIESVDLIDFDYGPANAYWHTTQDTLDKCSRESLDAIGRIVLAGLGEVERRAFQAR